MVARTKAAMGSAQGVCSRAMRWASSDARRRSEGLSLTGESTAIASTHDARMTTTARDDLAAYLAPFGLSSFRPGQEEIVETLIIAPRGGGFGVGW